MSLTGKDVMVRQLQEQLADYESDLKKSQSKVKKLRGCLNTLAEKLCDGQYGVNQLGGPNKMLELSETELRDFILQNVLNQRSRFASNVKELQKLFFQEQTDKENISKQLLDAQRECEMYKKAYEEEVKKAEEFQKEIYGYKDTIEKLQSEVKTKKIPEKKTDNPMPTSVDTVSSSVMLPKQPVSSQENSTVRIEKQGRNTEENDKIIYLDGKPYSVQDTYNKTDVYQIQILKFMAESGKNEIKEVVSALQERPEFGNQTTIKNMLNTMVDNLLVAKEECKTPKRKTFYLYYLTELGRAIYFKECHRKPIKDDMTRIREMHATLNHGYLILDTVELLRQRGYTDVCMDSSKNTINVPGGKRYVPDIIAYSNVTKKTFWEIELGHHHDVDFFEKLEKASQVTKELYVVTNDKASRDKVMGQVQKLGKKLRQEKRQLNMTVYVGTYTNLDKKMYLDNPDNICKL